MKALRTSLLAAVLLLSLPVILVEVPEEASAYTSHAPIRIEGNADFTAPGAGFGCECVSGGSGTTSDPYVIEGWDVNTTSAHGIEVRNTTSAFAIRDVFVHASLLNPPYSGVYLFNVSDGGVVNATASGNRYGILAESVRDVTFANNTMPFSLLVGISVSASRNVVASGNYIAKGVVSIWMNDSADATVERNVLHDAIDGLDAVNVQNLTLLGNEATLHDWIAYSVATAPNVVIRDNLADDAVGYGILVEWAPNATVEGNVVRGSQRGIGLGSESEGLLCQGNSVSDGEYGFELHAADGIIVRRNNVTNQSVDAIDVYLGDGLSIVENNLSYNWHGVRVDDAVSVTIAGNNITNNIGSGIQVDSSGVVVKGNTIASNAVGIDSFAGDNLTVVGNRISGNGEGIRFRYSENMTVHHNNLAGNTIQAYDDRGGENAWDDGYPSGGNYWSDYTGVDLFSGPDQDQPGSDGIGDTPYVIDADSQDRYPFMSPSNASLPLPPKLRSVTLASPAGADLAMTWSPSISEGIPGGVVAYRVLQAIGDAVAPYVEIGTVPASGLPAYTYVCAGCGHVPGDTTAHFYKVQAVDASNHTADGNLAARYAKPLSAGMNLVTVPLKQANDSLATVLQTIRPSVVSVRTYDAANASDPWKAYVTAKGHGEIAQLPFGSAFWVNVTAAGQYTVAGLLVDRPTVLLHPGWNLVAYASLANETVATSLAGLSVTRVEAFAAIPDPYRLRVAAADEPLVWGEAYWVCATAEGLWAQG